ncbi:unnamed protein product [Moneuplotes crassus]|uniref:Nudix hydrolase domain-containing protein n=2 Tax=Euplotes crassus TaxID=5936 RepID=A0AAD2D638_EUPCR|nr:unnamed protein product [Moneuplotes crassus]
MEATAEKSTEKESRKLQLKEPTLVHEGKWLNYYNVPFTSENKEGLWEVVGRIPPTSEKIKYSGVIVIPTAVDPETNEKIVLIEKIYRVPIQKYSLEFPAGMRDKDDDDPCATALRELKEETGYTGQNPKANLDVKTDPWKSMGTHCHVEVEVDLTLEENKNPKQDLEFEEDITTMWVKIDGLKETLENLAQEMDCDLDQRLYSWALGIGFVKNFGI